MNSIIRRFLVLIVLSLQFLPALATFDCRNLKIIQKPILFNQERIQLTQAYRRYHYGVFGPSIEIIPRIIVLHWTATPTLDSAFKIFNSPVLSGRPQLDAYGKLNVSAHYLVDRDGTIYQLMPDHWMARHVIGLNLSAIGIENVGGNGANSELTAAQLRANVCLIKYLKKKYPTIEYVIGHYEYLQFKNTPLWIEKIKGYQDTKVDPGKRFMEEVRQNLK